MIKRTSNTLLFLGAVILFVIFNIVAPGDAVAQQKSEYEKKQEEKIKKYRKRIKSSRGDRARSNRKQLRFLQFGTRNNQGDRPYKGKASKYNRKRRIPSSSTPSVYAQPDPYAFRSKRYQKRKVYSNDALKIVPRGSDNPYSGNVKPARRWQDRSRGRINVYPQPNPYSHRKLRSEGDRMSNRQGNLATDPRDPERTSGRKRIKTRSASGRYTINRRAKPYKLRDRKKWEETYTGGFYGRRSGIEPRNTQKTSAFGQPDPYNRRGRLGDKPYSGNITGGARYNTATKRGENAWKGDIAGKKIRKSRIRTGGFNVYPRVDPYANRKMRSERQRISKTQGSLGTDPKNTQRAAKRGRVKIRSASGRYTVNRRAKPYKLKDVKKWEETYTGGFYGRRGGIEPRNTQRISTFISPDPYKNRGRLGDKAYSGRITGGFNTAIKKGQRAWKGDIAGRRIDYSKPRDTQRSGGYAQRIPSASGGLHNNRGRAIINSAGSMSSRMNRNNNGKAILSFTPGSRALNTTKYQGNQYLFEIAPGFQDGNIGYQGDIKTRRPLKGGGSIPRADWNNKGRALSQKYNTGEARLPGAFSGDLKADKPFKGGGSLARNNWNNKGRALPKRHAQATSGGFSGNIKTSRPLKGGGSLARNDWNNKGQALPRRYNQATSGGFSGDLKTSRPAKGGGSLARNNWNNKGRALSNKYVQSTSAGFSGNIKTSRPAKGGGTATRDNWNNNETSTNPKSITPVAYYMTRHTGSIKNKKRYKRNKAVDDDAMRAREPNKAYFQAGSFQGNIKRNRRKPEGSLHTSTKFYSSRDSDNAVEEKKKFISFKLLWNKLFNKEEPAKEKERKPRYDKNEKDLWYD